MFVVDNYKIAYLHINKTAGTSIKGFLSDLVGENNIKQMGPTHGPLEPNIRIMGDRFNEYKILVSIRNPFARVISIYLFRKTRYKTGDRSATTKLAYEMPLKEWFLEIIRHSDRLTDMSITKSMLVANKLPDNVYTVALETIEKDIYYFCKDVLGVEQHCRVPHLNKTNFVRDHYIKYIDDELKEAIYQWDKWIIDEYYPWVL